MALVYKARVWERATVTGTGPVALAGVANAGPWQTFRLAGIIPGSTFYYCIADNINNVWELGLGTITGSPGTISRAVVESSNGNQLVPFAGAVCDITLEIPSPVLLSAGSINQGQIPALNTNGLIDPSMLGIPRLALPAPVGGIITLPFLASSDVCYEGTISANVTIALSGGSTAYYQRIILAISENTTGGFTITLPSSPTVKWPGGQQPTPVITANARNVFVFTSTGAAGTYDGNY